VGPSAEKHRHHLATIGASPKARQANGDAEAIHVQPNSRTTWGRHPMQILWCVIPPPAWAGKLPESLNIQLLVDSIPALIHTARPDGYLGSREPALSLGEGSNSRKRTNRSSSGRMPRTGVRTVRRTRQARDRAIHAGIENSVSKNQQASLQGREPRNSRLIFPASL